MKWLKNTNFDKKISLSLCTLFDKLGEQKMNKEDILKKRVSTVCKATGWDEETAKANIEHSYLFGLTSRQYVAYKAWDFNDSELEELKEILDLDKAIQDENERWHTLVACEKSGKTYEEMSHLISIARKRGYSLIQFIRKGIYLKSESEIAELPKPEKKKPSERKKADAAKKKKQLNGYYAIMMKEMGWSPTRLRLEALRASVICGCNDSEFYLFGIYKNGADEGCKYITSKYNSRMITRYCDWTKNAVNLFENKGLFNMAFDNFVKRTWFLSDSISFDQFCETVSGLDKIIAKPLKGIEGIGIRIYDVKHNRKSYRKLFSEIVAGPPSIVEQFLTQHPAISEIYPNALNTIRVMSFLDNGEGKILNAVMKFATNSNVDNYYQGGLAAGVDVKTGVLCTNGVDYQGNLYELHPYSGKQLKGFQIPHWDKVVELIREAAAIHPKFSYIGWDIAITPDGPEIVEGNHNQGAYLCQYPFAVCLNEGRRFTIDPYLGFDEQKVKEAIEIQKKLNEEAKQA